MRIISPPCEFFKCKAYKVVQVLKFFAPALVIAGALSLWGQQPATPSDGILKICRGGGMPCFEAAKQQVERGRTQFVKSCRLFYVQGHQGFEVSYLTPETDKGVEDHQGGATSNLWFQQLLVALDYRTGRERWRYNMPSAANGGLGVGAAIGVLTTAGRVLITGDNAGNAVALDPETGRTLWHAPVGENVSGSPMTYEIEGKQYIRTAAGSVVYAFALPAS
jgi:outer membrane protein assembly factor BamB